MRSHWNFIIDVDELLMNTYLPASICDNVDKTKFATPKKEKKDQNMQALVDYSRSGLYVILTVLFVYFYFTYWQLAIPGFKHDIHKHCEAMLAIKPKCAIFETDCFPWCERLARLNVWSICSQQYETAGSGDWIRRTTPC